MYIQISLTLKHFVKAKDAIYYEFTPYLSAFLRDAVLILSKKKDV